MRRLALFSPVPPAATGIADYTADVLPLLVSRFGVDVFHDESAPDRSRLAGAAGAVDTAGAPGVYHHSEFARLDSEHPYDLAVYQVGNAPAHDFLYPWLERRPGLVVLHDLVLHHARARMFLDGPASEARRDPSSLEGRRGFERAVTAYAAEVRSAYPAQADRLIAAHLGTVGVLLPYAYPLFRPAVASARAVAVHNTFMAGAVREEVPEAEVVRIPMPVSAVPVPAGAVEALRARYGLAPGAFVVGTFGLVTPEKRVETVARAVVRASPGCPDLRLLVVGPLPDRPALESRLAALGALDRTVLTGRVPFEELAAHMELCDAVVHLRYPTARETSAALLRALAQGRPTVMADLSNLGDVPSDAVLRADVADEEGEVTRALLRLCASPALRARLGSAARAFVAREHAPAVAGDAYAAAVELAISPPDHPSRDG